MGKFLVYLALGLMAAAAGMAFAAEVEKPASCEQCGMDRTAFAQSRMLVVYADGTIAGTCSIHCAVLEMKAHKGKKVEALKVADYGTKTLIDAAKAVWVIGGSKNGVMTALAKWAFADRAEAEKFVRESGGRVTTFEEALELAERETSM